MSRAGETVADAACTFAMCCRARRCSPWTPAVAGSGRATMMRVSSSATVALANTEAMESRGRAGTNAPRSLLPGGYTSRAR